MKWLSLMPASPPAPMKRFFTPLAMPATSCGTTWPMERMRSWPPCQMSLFSCAGHGRSQMPAVMAATSAPGTSPMVTTSRRQSWMRKSPGGTSGYMCAICCGVIGTWVPSAGSTSVSAAP